MTKRNPEHLEKLGKELSLKQQQCRLALSYWQGYLEAMREIKGVVEKAINECKVKIELVEVKEALDMPPEKDEGKI